MIKGIGIDLVELARIQEAVEKYGERFLNRIFTELEIDYCNQRTSTSIKHYAARFAAKEALSKALGTGIAAGVSWKDAEIKNLPSGEPQIFLYGKAKELCPNCVVHVSLTHTNTSAAAVVVIEKIS